MLAKVEDVEYFDLLDELVQYCEGNEEIKEVLNEVHERVFGDYDEETICLLESCDSFAEIKELLDDL